MVDCRLQFMSYEDARESLKNSRIALLPVGSVEQHGPANPLGTDYLIAEALAFEASCRANVLSLPVIPFGISFHHMGFPGTISVMERALEEYLFYVVNSLSKWGIDKVIVVNGHGGNQPVLQVLARRAREELGVRVFIYQWWTSSKRVVDMIFNEDEEGHAGAAETSLIMYLYPDKVSKEKIVDEKPKGELGGGKVSSFIYTHELSDSGVFGKQSTASVDRGRALFNSLVDDLVNLIESLKST